MNPVSIRIHIQTHIFQTKAVDGSQKKEGFYDANLHVFILKPLVRVYLQKPSN
jgi:hypothetical protein